MYLSPVVFGEGGGMVSIESCRWGLDVSVESRNNHKYNVRAVYTAPLLDFNDWDLGRSDNEDIWCVLNFSWGYITQIYSSL